MLFTETSGARLNPVVLHYLIVKLVVNQNIVLPFLELTGFPEKDP